MLSWLWLILVALGAWYLLNRFVLNKGS